jgi:glutamate--cysteine ligase
VRPRGWLEVRYIDAQPAAFWPVPLAVLWALVSEPAADEHVLAAARPVRDAWEAAAQTGLRHPAIAHAADTCFKVALDILRGGDDASLTALVEAFLHRYVLRRRSPADDTTSPLAATEEVSR